MTRGKDCFRQLFNSLPDALACHQVVTDSQGKPVDYILFDVNPAFEEMAGLKRDEILGRKVAEILPGIEKSGFDWIETYGKVAFTGQSVRVEVFFEPLERYYEATAFSMEKDYFITVFKDISESQLFSIFDSINEIIYVADPHTYEILYVNPFTEKVFSKDLVGGLCYKELQNKESPCEFCTNRIILKNKGVPYQWEYYNPLVNKHYLITDKIIKWPDGRDVRFELAIDITGRTQTEEALKESEKKYREILSTMEEGYYEVDLAGNFVFFNDSFCNILGYNRDDLYNVNYKKLYREPEVVFKTFNRVYHSGKPEKAAGWLLMAGDGRELYIEVSISLRRNEEGKAIGFRGVARDITGRKSAEDELRNAHRRLDDIIEFLPDATVVVDNYGTVIAWNKAIEEMTGVPKKNMLGKGNYEYAIPFYGKRQPILVNLALMPAEQQSAMLEQNYDIGRSKEDTLFGEVYCPETYGGKGAYLFASASKLRDASGNIVGAIETIRDITDRKQAEQKIADYSRELEQLNTQLDKEMEKARLIHERSFLAEIPEVEDVSLAAYYQPAQKLGGDFYNVIKTDNKLILYLSDVMGHGMDGAMLSIFVKETIDGYISLKPDDIHPEKILRYLDRQYRRENYPEEYLICIFLAVLDLKTLELSYCAAGFQTSPLVRQGNGKLFNLTSKGLPISFVIPPELMEFKADHLALTPGTTIFFSTDGLMEQTVNEELYNNRLGKVFSDNSHLPPDFIVQFVKEDFRTFNRGCLQGSDDITFCILQVDPEQKESICLELASCLEELGRLQKEASGVLPDSEEAKQLLTGLNELAANAMEHGNRFNPDKKMFVEITVTGECLAAIVEDQGVGFNWQEKLSSSLDLQGTEERGRGIIMTNMLCDRLFYSEKGSRALLIVKGDEC